MGQLAPIWAHLKLLSLQHTADGGYQTGPSVEPAATGSAKLQFRKVR
jgi:hypothetical protein